MSSPATVLRDERVRRRRPERPRRRNKSDKKELAKLSTELDIYEKELIRREVIENSRFDILAEDVLGFTIEAVHREIFAHVLENKETLTLAFRGCGKTTIICVYIAGRLLQNPELRILIVSKSLHYAKAILKEVKGHFENERFIEIFGNLKSRDKWEESEANLKTKKRNTKEANLTALGVEGAITGRHFDVLIPDDLVDEDNSRTPTQRKRIKTFWDKTLDPCLEPFGEKHVSGTRYHPHDLYGDLADGEFKGNVQVIPCLVEKHVRSKKIGRVKKKLVSTSPVRFPLKYLLRKRKRLAAIVWTSQWLCQIERFKGDIFPPELFEKEGFYYTRVPEGAYYWQVVDPATGESATGATKDTDFFAHLTIAEYDDELYLVDYSSEKIRFPKQVTTTCERFDDADPIRLGIESNGYQGVLAQQIREDRPDVWKRIIPIPTSKDKVSRGWKLLAVFEKGKIHFRREHQTMIECLLEFPHGEHDDLFDVLEMGVKLASGIRVRKRRAQEPGVF